MSDKVKVYVWEFPVRFTHWINVICLLALSITGFYVGNPFILAQSSDQYIMGWMRFIHFVSAYAFLMSMIIRLYWAFLGNKYAAIRTWFPFSSREMSEIFKEFKFYFFISKEPPSVVGHTAFGGLTMLIMFGVFFFEIISGFALYSVTHSGVIWTALGGWLLGFMSLQTVRLFHHLFMYAIIIFTLIHVYIVQYSNYHEKNGLMSSIFFGYKYASGNENDL